MSWNTRFILIVAHGVAMLGLGLALFYIRATMTNALFDVFGSIFALMLVAASLLFSAVLDWVCAAGAGLHHLRELRRYLQLSMVTAAAGLFFALYPSASIRMLSYVIAAYAVLLGMGKVRLAYHWQHGGRERGVLYILGAVAILFSGVLAAVAGLEERDAIGALGAYSFFVGVQMLLTVRYLYREQAPIQEMLKRRDDRPKITASGA